MSLTHYGIYLVYPPTIDLRYEGLGRLLAAFIKGSIARGDIRFVIVCPSWNKSMLLELFQSEGISKDCVDIYYPKGQSVILKVHRYIRERKRKRLKLKKPSFLANLKVIWKSLEKQCLQKLVTVRSIFSLAFYAVLSIPFFLVRFITFATWFFGIKGSKKGARKVRRFFGKKFISFKEAVFDPKNNAYLTRIYQYIEEAEIQLMHHIIDAATHVRAWYSPTAFWPSFNQIKAPKLMCVPDVVLTEFPIGFCNVGGYRFLDTFRKVEKTIRGGEYFVTYSHYIKESTLVNRYGVKPERVTVIPHSANKLDGWLSQKEVNPKMAPKVYYRHLLVSALQKATNGYYARLFKNTDIKFFFYASQFRPSKNILTLLRAYKFLLRNRFISHKLILTGRLRLIKDIDEFIHQNRLGNDVLLLPGLTTAELAACYKLADLVINPSLSEGGCPFTFTEALSVNTPVIMSNIPVTTEVITDEKLQEMMLFDPYNWRDLANKVEWALANRTELLTQQIAFYNDLKERTWTHVVDDHIEVLDYIAHASKTKKLITEHL
jgi:glycosyltransferase involved in cell wall biosynthesis